jgi:hypothetical protein
MKMSYIFVFVAFFTSCKTKNKDTSTQKDDLKAYINNLTVDHVVHLRDWCRFSLIFLKVTFSNNSKDTVYIKHYPYDDCDYSGNSSDFTLHSRDSIYRVAIKESQAKYAEYLKIPPTTTDTLHLFLLLNLREVNLKRIVEKHIDILNSNIKLKSVHLFKKNKRINLSIHKSKDFKILYFLDDKEVFKKDTAAFNYYKQPPIIE